MKKPFWLFTFLVLAILLAGCTTRSISDSGYKGGNSYGRSSDNPFYKGELSEFQVLGIDPSQNVTESQIQEALANSQRVSVRRGSGIMLVQSGAMIPDDSMVINLERYFKVAVFTGVPNDSVGGSNYAKTLRLAAAHGGYENILVYWGLLESAQENLATKSVSWVPIVGWVLPDESQHMRIRLKVALIGVKTGSWDMFSPEPFSDEAYSGMFSREGSDQAQVATLKEKAYIAAVEDLVKRYTNLRN